MFKKIFLTSILLATGAAQAATTLAAGDIAFTSFKATEPDAFSFVTLVDIAANTSITFTDRSWNGSSFGSGEGSLVWNSGTASISAGSVVSFAAQVSSGPIASTSAGSFSLSGSFALGQSGETLYAYQGSATNTLAAVSNQAAATVFTGLSSGANLLSLAPSTNYSQYAGSTRSGTVAELKAALTTAANWNASSSTLDTVSFKVTPVPEPSGYAMLLAGLGMMGAIARRRTHA